MTTSAAHPTEEQLLARALRTSASFHKHARGCKKPLDDCKQCRDSVAYHGSLPLPTLAIVLEDRPVRRAAADYPEP